MLAMYLAGVPGSSVWFLIDIWLISRVPHSTEELYGACAARRGSDPEWCLRGRYQGGDLAEYDILWSAGGCGGYESNC